MISAQHIHAAASPPDLQVVIGRLREDVERVAQNAEASARICRAATTLRLDVREAPDHGLVLQLGPDALAVLDVGAPADGTVSVPADLLDGLWERHLPADLLEGIAVGQGRVRPALMVLPVLRAAAR